MTDLPLWAMEKAKTLWARLGFVNDRLNQIPAVASALAEAKAQGRREAFIHLKTELSYWDRDPDGQQGQIALANALWKEFPEFHEELSEMRKPAPGTLAEARCEALEEAATHARCAFDDRPRRDSLDWNDGFDDGTKAAASAIRKLMEQPK